MDLTLMDKIRNQRLSIYYAANKISFYVTIVVRIRASMQKKSTI